MIYVMYVDVQLISTDVIMRSCKCKESKVWVLFPLGQNSLRTNEIRVRITSVMFHVRLFLRVLHQVYNSFQKSNVMEKSFAQDKPQVKGIPEEILQLHQHSLWPQKQVDGVEKNDASKYSK